MKKNQSSMSVEIIEIQGDEFAAYESLSMCNALTNDVETALKAIQQATPRLFGVGQKISVANLHTARAADLISTVGQRKRRGFLGSSRTR